MGNSLDGHAGSKACNGYEYVIHLNPYKFVVPGVVRLISCPGKELGKIVSDGNIIGINRIIEKIPNGTTGTKVVGSSRNNTHIPAAIKSNAFGDFHAYEIQAHKGKGQKQGGYQVTNTVEGYP